MSLWVLRTRAYAVVSNFAPKGPLHRERDLCTELAARLTAQVPGESSHIYIYIYIYIYGQVGPERSENRAGSYVL